MYSIFLYNISIKKPHDKHGATKIQFYEKKEKKLFK